MQSNNDKLFRLVLIRHEQSYYSDKGHDLAPDGVERAIKIGVDLKKRRIIDPEQEVCLFHSPKPRARGTLDFIVQGAGLTGVYTEAKDLRCSDYADLDAFLSREKELALTPEDVAREHYENHELYEDSPHIVESHTKRRSRFYRFLSELVLRYMLADASAKQVIAVSHFEIIMHIIHDVFDIKSFSSYMAPMLGEYIVIDFLPDNDSGSIQLILYFRDRIGNVKYDFVTRSIVDVI